MKFFLRVIDWSGLNAHALRLRARGAWHFCAVGIEMPNVLIAACVTQGVALGYGQHLGFQPATIKTIAHIILYMYRCICKLILQNILVVVIDLI